MRWLIIIQNVLHALKKCFKLAILSLIHGRHSCAYLFRQSLATESGNRSEEKDQVAESVS